MTKLAKYLRREVAVHGVFGAAFHFATCFAGAAFVAFIIWFAIWGPEYIVIGRIQ